MNTKSAGVLVQAVKGKVSLDEELAEIIRHSSEQMPSLVKQIRDGQQYCSNIKAFVAEVAVKEDWTNG